MDVYNKLCYIYSRIMVCGNEGGFILVKDATAKTAKIVTVAKNEAEVKKQKCNIMTAVRISFNSYPEVSYQKFKK